MWSDPRCSFVSVTKTTELSSSRRNALCCTTLSTAFLSPFDAALSFHRAAPQQLDAVKRKHEREHKRVKRFGESLCCYMLINIFTFTKLTFRNENLCKTTVNFMDSGSWLSSRFSGEALQSNSKESFEGFN